MEIRSYRWLSALALAAAVPAGCGGEGPQLEPVEGTVTFDGEPLADASLTFVPDRGNAEETPGTAVTTEDGTYRARYQGRYGLATGRYKVTFRKLEVPPEAAEGMPKVMLDDPVQLEMMGVVEQTLPDSYADLNKTASTVTVAEGGGPYDFDLDSEGR